MGFGKKEPKKVKTFKFKMYPTKKQRGTLDFWLETLKDAYNDWNGAIDYARQKEGIWLSKLSLGKRILKYRNMHPKLSQINARIVEHSVRDRLINAHQRYEKALKSKKCTDNRDKFKPKFKSIEDFNSFQGDGQVFNIVKEGSKLKVHLPPKIGKNRSMLIVIRGPELPDNYKICGSNFVKEGKDWFLCLVLEIANPTAWEKTQKAVGIDVNIGSVDLSDGTSIDMPFFNDQYMEKIVEYQRKMDRSIRLNNRVKSKAYKRLGAKKARLEKLAARERKAYQHQITTWIVQNYDRIYVEDLKPSHMVKNKFLAKSIMAQAWYTFFEMLRVKCEQSGKIFAKVDPRGTTQTCNKCGYINKGDNKLTLAVRAWKCPSCGENHDRDLNAALNILNRGEKMYKSGEINYNELKTGTIIVKGTSSLPISKNIKKPDVRSRRAWDRLQRAKRAIRINRKAKKERESSKIDI